MLQSTAVLGRPAVEIREWEERDAEALAAMYAAARAAVEVEMPWVSAEFFTARGQRVRIRRCRQDGAAEGFVITAAGAIAGHLSLDAIGRDVLRSAEIGYWIAPRYRGRGVATAAIQRATARAFAGQRLTRLHATVDARNAVSRRTLERGGFRCVGQVGRPPRAGEDTAILLLYQLPSSRGAPAA